MDYLLDFFFFSTPALTCLATAIALALGLVLADLPRQAAMIPSVISRRRG
jgi:hypothetical protein